MSLACNQPQPILDGNVKRVLSRYHRVAGHYSDSKTLKEFWRLAKYHTPSKQNANYTQAIMDLGATIVCLANLFAQGAQFPDTVRQTFATIRHPFLKKKQEQLGLKSHLHFWHIVTTRGEAYLVKRPNKGVWGGLWSFEECEDTETAITAAIKEHNLEASIVSSLPKFKHSFTHYHLWIRPIIISSPGLEKELSQY